MVALTAAASAVSTAVASAPLTTAATLVGGYSAYQEAQAQNRAASAKANAVAVEAEQVKQQGMETEIRQRQKVAAIVGEQKVGFASSGVDIGSGTPTDVVADTKTLGNADALTIRANTKRQVMALQEEQKGYNNSKINPWMSAGTTVLTSFAGGEIFKRAGAAFKAARASQKMAEVSSKAMKTWQGALSVRPGQT